MQTDTEVITWWTERTIKRLKELKDHIQLSLEMVETKTELQRNEILDLNLISGQKHDGI